jgi:hypothetical protein
MTYENSSYRSGAVRTIPESEIKRRPSDIRSGSVDGQTSHASEDTKPNGSRVTLIEQRGRLIVVER